GEIESTAREGNAGALRERIESLEARASRLRLPRSFTQSVYHLREHIRFVEARLDRLAGDQKPSPPTG
ncbi:MAG TPA: hypothetical protein VK454_00450, partial [Myxococcaceae bacterium]|nr:hypothetical protein [Myxococcaceae bacterium]